MIKIVGGKYRSRSLSLPPLDEVRPTQDIVRKAVFSALGEHMDNLTVLDLFAGSGAYGFESLSRGAAYVVFVDSNSKCIKAINETGKNFNCLSQVRIDNDDVKKELLRLAEQKKCFDCVFMDPPYADDCNSAIIMELAEKGLLKEKGIVVAEQEQELKEIPGFTLKAYRYSYKKVGIYRRKE